MGERQTSRLQHASRICSCPRMLLSTSSCPRGPARMLLSARASRICSCPHELRAYAPVRVGSARGLRAYAPRVGSARMLRASRSARADPRSLHPPHPLLACATLRIASQCREQHSRTFENLIRERSRIRFSNVLECCSRHWDAIRSVAHASRGWGGCKERGSARADRLARSIRAEPTRGAYARSPRAEPTRTGAYARSSCGQEHMREARADRSIRAGPRGQELVDRSIRGQEHMREACCRRLVCLSPICANAEKHN